MVLQLPYDINIIRAITTVSGHINTYRPQSFSFNFEDDACWISRLHASVVSFVIRISLCSKTGLICSFVISALSIQWWPDLSAYYALLNNIENLPLHLLMKEEPIRNISKCKRLSGCMLMVWWRAQSFNDERKHAGEDVNLKCDELSRWCMENKNAETCDYSIEAQIILCLVGVWRNLRWCCYTNHWVCNQATCSYCRRWWC